jgi:histone H2A
MMDDLLSLFVGGAEESQTNEDSPREEVISREDEGEDEKVPDANDTDNTESSSQPVASVPTKRIFASSNKKHRGPKTSRSTRAGLAFPVGRVERQLRRSVIKHRLSKTAPVYLAACLEYLTREILQECSLLCRVNKIVRIRPRTVFQALVEDNDFSILARNCIIPESGVRISACLPTTKRRSSVTKASGKRPAKKKKTHEPPSSIQNNAEPSDVGHEDDTEPFVVNLAQTANHDAEIHNTEEKEEDKEEQEDKEEDRIESVDSGSPDETSDQVIETGDSEDIEPSL